MFVFNCCRTQEIVLRSLQETRSSRLYALISKVSTFFSTFLEIAQDSHRYDAIAKAIDLMILSFSSLLTAYSH